MKLFFNLQIKRRGNSVKSSDEKEEEKPKEVVHVRAKRGQATDSHSLAERVTHLPTEYSIFHLHIDD